MPWEHFAFHFAPFEPGVGILDKACLPAGKLLLLPIVGTDRVPKRDCPKIFHKWSFSAGVVQRIDFLLRCIRVLYSLIPDGATARDAAKPVACCPRLIDAILRA